jgi:hypothetical protein
MRGPDESCPRYPFIVRSDEGLATRTYAPKATTWVKIKKPAYSQAEGRAHFFEGRKAARV